MFHRRCHRDRRGWGRRRGGLWRRRRLDSGGGLAAPEPWRHDGLFDFGGIADRTGDQPALGLLVVSRRAGKPALETVVVIALERVADHAGPRTARRCVGSAIGSITSKRRPCCNEGIRPRAAAIAAGSTSARMTPGSSLASAST